MEKHFTATAYIIDAEKVLLIYHKKLNKWLPPGGHIDPNETPPEAVKREVLEETGLEIEIFKNEHVWINHRNAKSIERPYMCLLENIPEHQGKPAHQHIDMIFVAYPTGGSIKENERETSGIRWFSLEDIELLKPDREIFVETIETLRNIFNEQALYTSEFKNCIWASVKAPEVESKKTGSYYNIDQFFLTSTPGL